MSSPKNPDLQLLRGIAILLVVFGHLSLSSAILKEIDAGLANPFFWGVELFFVLSGFVVTRSIVRKNFNGPYFLAKRLFRLYPAMLFMVVLAIILNQTIQQSKFPDHVIRIFSIDPQIFSQQSLSVLGGYLINRFPSTAYQFGQMWSLSVEFQFYAFFAALLIMVSLLNDRIKFRVIVSIFASIFVALLLYRFMLGTGLVRGQVKFITYLSNYRFDFLAAGVLLAAVPDARLRAWLAPFCKPALPWFALLSTTVLLAFLKPSRSLPAGTADYLNSIGMIFTLAACVFLVALGAVGGLEKSRFTGRMRSALILLGDYSYTIYLVHFSMFILAWILIYSTISFVFKYEIYFGLAQLFAFIIVSIPFIYFSYHKVELVGISVGNRLISLSGRGWRWATARM